jgi:hypothetical protein
MHELVGLSHSMTHAVVGLCRDETKTSQHIDIRPAEEGWTAANDNERYLVAAQACNVLQQPAHVLCGLLVWTSGVVSVMSTSGFCSRVMALCCAVLPLVRETAFLGLRAWACRRGSMLWSGIVSFNTSASSQATVPSSTRGCLAKQSAFAPTAIL